MKESDHLFRLIKSLNKTEKRYIKVNFLNVAQHESNHLKLFDMLDKQKEYDHNNLKQHFKNEAFAKQINVAKLKLYELILKALRNYNSLQSPLFRSLNHSQNTEILISKGLYEMSEIELDKGKHIADRNNIEFALPVIYYWETEIFFRKKNTNKLNIATLVNERNKTLRSEEITYAYWQLYSDLYLNSKESNRSPKSRLKAIGQMPLFKKFSGTNLRAKIYYYNLKAIYFYMNNKLNISIRYFKKLLSLFKHNHIFIPEKEKDVWSKIFGCCINYLKAKRYNQLLDEIEELKNVPSLNVSSTAMKWFLLYCIPLTIHYQRGHYEKAKLFISEFYKGNKEYIKYYDSFNINVMYIQIAGFYLDNNDYSKCIKHLNSFLHDPIYKPTEIIIRFAKLILAFSHYEKKNIKIATTIFYELKRYAPKEKNKTELLILNLLGEFLISADEISIKKSIHNYVTKLKGVNELEMGNLINIKSYLHQKLRSI